MDTVAVFRWEDGCLVLSFIDNEDNSASFPDNSGKLYRKLCSDLMMNALPIGGDTHD